MYLELQVKINPEEKGHPLNCKVTYEGDREEEVSLDPERNLVTRTAMCVIFVGTRLLLMAVRYVLRCHGRRSFPVGTHVHIINPIPLGRGLGSSGAAVVGGVALANEVANLNLPKSRMLVYCKANLLKQS
jgi:homoserine kinase